MDVILSFAIRASREQDLASLEALQAGGASIVGLGPPCDLTGAPELMVANEDKAQVSSCPGVWTPDKEMETYKRLSRL